MTHSQPDLFQPAPSLPEGFRYRPEFLSADEERDLAQRFANLPFKEFEFRGYRGNRRVLSFGWHYDFNRMELQETEDMPAFLLSLRERAAVVAEPRSAYLLQGPSRTEWEHSIPPVDSLRYSITFRNLKSSD